MKSCKKCNDKHDLKKDCTSGKEKKVDACKPANDLEKNRESNLGALDAKKAREKGMPATVKDHQEAKRPPKASEHFEPKGNAMKIPPRPDFMKKGMSYGDLRKAEELEKSIKVPKDHPVQPLKPGQAAKDRVTCGNCNLSWDDGISTSMTPAPSARCPFEPFHKPEKEPKMKKSLPSLNDLRKAEESLVKAEAEAMKIARAARQALEAVKAKLIKAEEPKKPESDDLEDAEYSGDVICRECGEHSQYHPELGTECCNAPEK